MKKMLNFKQEEVLGTIINKLKKKYSEVKLENVEYLAPDTFWVVIKEPSDEDEAIEMDDLLGDLVTDALVDYGFSFRFVPASRDEIAA